MSRAARLTERAEAYVRKPSLAPLPATGEADARRLAESVRWARQDRSVNFAAESAASDRTNFALLRLAAGRELSTPATPED